MPRKKLMVYLRDYRIKHNMNERQMCEAIGICYTTYSRLENGYAPSFKVTEKLANYFQLDAMDIRSMLWNTPTN